MKHKDAFSTRHPAVRLLFFGILFLFSCVCTHPLCLLILLLTAIRYFAHLKQEKAPTFFLKWVFPLFAFAVVINPVFSHAGATVLCHLPDGNPLTLESILYGIQAGVMLTGFLLWFACFSEVVTSDDFIYVFGRIAPSFSLLLSMTLRFIPRFKRQFDAVKEVQNTLGYDAEKGRILKRVKNALACFSAVVTWSLESAVNTSDSMKNRGYGTGKRTAYSVHPFTESDQTALLFILLGGIILFGNEIAGHLSWQYYPTVQGVLTEPMTIFTQIVFLIFCLTPIIMERKEEFSWKHFKSKT